MDSSPAFLQEFHEMYSEISSGKAVFRTLQTLKELREDAVYWIEGTIISVDTNREFCYLACRICEKKVEEVDGMKRCMHCGEYTFRNIFRYNVEVVVADESDTARMILWNRASEKLIGEPAEDVIALYGDTARIMPDDIAEKFLGREGLFELVVSSQQLHVDGFNVSRLSVDEEIKDVYIMKNYPDYYYYDSNSEPDSFLETLNYVEVADRAVNKTMEAHDQEADNANKDIETEIDAEAEQTPKKQKREGGD
ncbi:hypothetical protein CASFOL_001228 [Castilleja foliolosa]|uniref:Replication factor A C-terminal domain-containing protein n=1 Tax=Castilleja foliolosa TaxID=1961234 RepID=A0ABD3BXV6_9LAMI